MTRNKIPGTNSYARSHEGQTIKSAIEAKLRAAVGDAAFDAIPDAPPRKATPADMRRPDVGAVVAEMAPAARKLRRIRRLPRQREKVFGDGRPLPLDREAKNRILVKARGLMH